MSPNALLYTKETLQLTQVGRQDCSSDLHSFGPYARNTYIIHYVIKGAGFLEYDNKCFAVRTGESFLICPYTIVRYYPDPNDPWEYTWINFRGKDAENCLQHCIMSKSSPVCPAIPAERIMPLFDRLISLNYYRSNQKEGGGLLLALLGLYADAFPSPRKRKEKELDSRLSAAILLIQSNYHFTDFNIEALCELIPCNRVTLYRLFQVALNKSPMQYLTEYRIRQACKMLDLGILVKTTALSCGFADPFYFSRAFKQHMGMSPAVYSNYIHTPEKL